MYKPTFGSKNQIRFTSESEYFKLLGFLAKSDGSTVLVWENNDLAGAWAKEGRILFYVPKPASLNVILLETAGLGRILFRVNCNEFIQSIRNDHNFLLGESQDIPTIRATVPVQFLPDFEAGLLL